MTEKQKQIEKLLQSLEHWTNERAKAKNENDAEGYTIAEKNRDQVITELLKLSSKK
jgi:hypothetical protein